MLLVPFSWLFGLGVMFRNFLFKVGILRATKISVPVISVGNLAIGGVGKTPLVEFLALRLRRQRRRVAVVSRGYKRKSRGYVVVSDGGALTVGAAQGGDEPAQLASKLQGVIVISDEQRDRGVRRAVKELSAEIIILDDGFQHRYVARDLDIVILSAKEILSGDRLLPAGFRREPLSSLQRADLIVISRCHDLEYYHQALEVLRRRFRTPVMGIDVRPRKIHPANSQSTLKLNKLAGKRVIAFSGIGDPDSFRRTLSLLDANVIQHVIFQDHHSYSMSDLASISTVFAQHSADLLITTEKDFKRLQGVGDPGREFLKNRPIYYLEIESKIIAGGDELDKLLKKF